MKIENLLKDAKGMAISRVQRAIINEKSEAGWTGTESLFDQIVESVYQVRAMERRAQRLADDLESFLST